MLLPCHSKVIRVPSQQPHNPPPSPPSPKKKVSTVPWASYSKGAFRVFYTMSHELNRLGLCEHMHRSSDPRGSSPVSIGVNTSTADMVLCELTDDCCRRYAAVAQAGKSLCNLFQARCAPPSWNLLSLSPNVTVTAILLGSADSGYVS